MSEEVKKEEKKAPKEPKEIKVFLKLAKKHPRKFMFLGRHKIEMLRFNEYSLNKKEQEELKSKGGQAWFKIADENDLKLIKEIAAKKKKKKKKLFNKED